MFPETPHTSDSHDGNLTIHLVYLFLVEMQSLDTANGLAIRPGSEVHDDK